MRGILPVFAVAASSLLCAGSIFQTFRPGLSPLSARRKAACLRRLLIVVALFNAAPVEAQPQRTYLASIAGVVLGQDQYVNRFSIETWSVEIEAVCYIPRDWQITAGGSAATKGSISGEGGHGVSFLSGSDLGKLKGLALVMLTGSIHRRERRTAGAIRPATFGGYVNVGAFDSSQHDRKVRLTSANIRLTPATRCPQPVR